MSDSAACITGLQKAHENPCRKYQTCGGTGCFKDIFQFKVQFVVSALARTIAFQHRVAMVMNESARAKSNICRKSE
jgi:hypothetical protein